MSEGHHGEAVHALTFLYFWLLVVVLSRESLDVLKFRVYIELTFDCSSVYNHVPPGRRCGDVPHGAIRYEPSYFALITVMPITHGWGYLPRSVWQSRGRAGSC